MKIPFGIETPSPPQGNFSPVIPSAINSPIPMGTNSKIHSGDISPIPFRDLSKIPEYTYATFYNSTSSAPTNPKIQLVEPDPTTYLKSNSNSNYETTITSPIKISNYKICQQIWSRILNDKQDSKYLKR